MNIHPDLRALRSDDAPQRHAQQALHRAMAAWRARPEFAALVDDLARLATGEPLDRCPALAALFADGGSGGQSLVSGFISHSAQALGDAPLAHVPMRHFTDGCTSTLLLARSGQVTLTLIALDGNELRNRPAPQNISFGPNETWELVLAGRAVADLIACEPSGPRSARLDRRALALAPGTVLQRDGQREARLVRSIEGTLVSLRLQRRRANAGPTREYNLESGALVHQAAGNPRDSRLELMLALLGRMQRKDAAPLMAALAQGDASAALRWQALRECLALDTQTGFTALSAIAGATGDALAGPAGALRAQLVEAHPQLQDLAQLQDLVQLQELATCPA